jgi:tetratricopeptide (TPR) repeat protein
MMRRLPQLLIFLLIIDLIAIWAITRDDVVLPSPGAYMMLGTTLLQMNRPEEAIPFLYVADRLSHGDYMARNNLGIAYGAIGRIDKARKAYNEALRLRPDNVHRALIVANLDMLSRLYPTTQQPTLQSASNDFIVMGGL